MTRAKAYGIDAFALNIGVDPYTDAQLGYAYASAARNGMKVFISFDFNWWSPGDASGVGSKIAQYAGQAAQLTVDGRVFRLVLCWRRPGHCYHEVGRWVGCLLRAQLPPGAVEQC